MLHQNEEVWKFRKSFYWLIISLAFTCLIAWLFQRPVSAAASASPQLHCHSHQTALGRRKYSFRENGGSFRGMSVGSPHRPSGETSSSCLGWMYLKTGWIKNAPEWGKCPNRGKMPQKGENAPKWEKCSNMRKMPQIREKCPKIEKMPKNGENIPKWEKYRNMRKMPKNGENAPK